MPWNSWPPSKISWSNFSGTPKTLSRKRSRELAVLAALVCTPTSLAAQSQPPAGAADRAGILREPVPHRLVVLTFDDAVVSHATFVAPLLEQLGFGATFFVVEFPPDFADKSKYMTWEQIRGLHEKGFEIGNHTGRHTHVTRTDRARLTEELECIENRATEHGIPRPVTFAYPAYVTHPSALPVLREKGYLFARTGGNRRYDPTRDQPCLIPSYGTSAANRDSILAAFWEARDGEIVVLTIHGVPDTAHPWVTTPPELFEEYLKYLHDHGYRVIALRDLARYVDVEKALEALAPAFRTRQR